MLCGAGGHVKNNRTQTGHNAHQARQRQQPHLIADAGVRMAAICGNQPGYRHNAAKRAKRNLHELQLSSIRHTPRAARPVSGTRRVPISPHTACAAYGKAILSHCVPEGQPVSWRPSIRRDRQRLRASSSGHPSR